jgi:hypothetical protein
MRLPLDRTKAGDSGVFVRAAEGWPACESAVAQLLQNLAKSVLSDWHFGHLTATADPFYQMWLKVIRE